MVAFQKKRRRRRSIMVNLNTFSMSNNARTAASVNFLNSLRLYCATFVYISIPYSMVCLLTYSKFLWTDSRKRPVHLHIMNNEIKHYRKDHSSTTTKIIHMEAHVRVIGMPTSKYIITDSPVNSLRSWFITSFPNINQLQVNATRSYQTNNRNSGSGGRSSWRLKHYVAGDT